jgi:3'-phosphoadenosine 5'-phosphosulfate sulfotransferase (PAPS reductase)/FAD synthetase
MIVHVASISSGKDSQATSTMMLKRFGRHRCRFVCCDTGNEDPAVFEHIAYLERKQGIKVDILKADFTQLIAERRMFVARDQRVRKRLTKKRDKDGKVVERRVVWVRHTNKAKRRILENLHPTGNPFLDLCLWKGRFPSRKAQFCTQELKTNLLTEYQMTLVDQGHCVVSWQGIRRDESANRKDAKLLEYLGGRLWIYRPIVDWTAQQTIDYILQSGLKPNPLYSEGFDRVGCMPCINCGKKDVKNIAARKPEEIARIAEWERRVGLASKRGQASFFPDPDRDAHLDKRGIHKVVQWAHTSRGGRQFSLIPEEGGGCSSSFGLCDVPATETA